MVLEWSYTNTYAQIDTLLKHLCEWVCVSLRVSVHNDIEYNTIFDEYKYEPRNGI